MVSFGMEKCFYFLTYWRYLADCFGAYFVFNSTIRSTSLSSKGKAG